MIQIFQECQVHSKIYKILIHYTSFQNTYCSPVRSIRNKVQELTRVQKKEIK